MRACPPRVPTASHHSFDFFIRIAITFFCVLKRARMRRDERRYERRNAAVHNRAQPVVWARLYRPAAERSPTAT